MQLFKSFEDRSITAKISLAVAALVTLTLLVSLADIFGLKSMERAVDSASRSAEILAAVNTATGRVEHFIATRDQESLPEAESMVAKSIANLADLSTFPQEEVASLTGNLSRLAAAIATLRAATQTMDAETDNMTRNYGQMREVTTLIEQGIAERQKALDAQVAAHDARERDLENAHRILGTLRQGERIATASVARLLAGTDETAVVSARNACAALPPLVAMLRETIDVPDKGNALHKLAAATAAAKRTVDSPAVQASEALQHLAAVWEALARIDAILEAPQELAAREKDDVQAKVGLLRNASALSKRFAERVATLEAQTLTFRLSPKDQIADAVDSILDELNRLSRVLPSAGMLRVEDGAFSVADQIAGYRAAFATFRQASGALREAHGQVRNEARTAGQLVARFASEARSASAVHKDRSVFAAVIASTIAILLAGAIAWHTSRLVARPVVALASVMRRLALGDLDHVIVGLNRKDEIGTMTRAVQVFQESALRVLALEAERKRDEDELRRLTLFQRTILNSAAYSIISATPEGIVTGFNPAAECLLGYAADEVVGKQTPALWHDPREVEQHALRLSDDLGEAIQPGFDVFAARPKRNLPEENEWTFIRKDGTRVPVNLSVAALRDESGSITGFVGLTYDLTERKRAEEEIRQLNQELEQRVVERTAQLEQTQTQLIQSEKLAAIGQLAAGVAHEINNPIGFVNSNLGTLKTYTGNLIHIIDTYETTLPFLDSNNALRGRIKEACDKADLAYLREDIGNLIAESIDGTSRVRRIVQDLRDFSRIDGGDWECADLHAGLESTLNVVWNEIKYKADVIREFGTIPLVECRLSQINQVFMNMLVNAAHAIQERGTITLRSGCEADQVWISFSDTGQGIPPELLNRIFDPFFTTKPVGKGTGLGLSVSFGIVRKHGGRIDVQSQLGEGTTFTVWLPIRQQDNADQVPS